jgi:hypothetical protein
LFLGRWQEDGWKVFTPDQLQAQGIAVLIEQLNPVRQIVDSETWKIQNSRRIKLIAKKTEGTLSELEDHELKILQETLESRLAEWDMRLIQEIASLEERIRRAKSE